MAEQASSSSSSRSSWEKKLEALTSVITHQTTSPSLYSQLLFSSQVPCCSADYYPPVLSSGTTDHLTWGLSHFLHRVSILRLPKTSWRSKCPYQQPPPLVLAKGIEPATWEDDRKRRHYIRTRTSRRPLESTLSPLIPFLLPNLMLLSLLFWNPPYPDRV